MSNKLEHKGFIGSVEFSSDDNLFFGKIEGINDLILFEGSTVDELKSSFEFMVNEHIKDCKLEKKPLLKSFRGNFNVRTSTELHQVAYFKAIRKGISLNKLVNEAIKSYVAL